MWMWLIYKYNVHLSWINYYNVTFNDKYFILIIFKKKNYDIKLTVYSDENE